MTRTPNHRLRRRLSVTLVGVALVSVVLLATVNYVFARLLLDDSVEQQLVAVRDTRVQALEIGAERIQSSVSALAVDPSVVTALAELSEEFERVDDDISPAQLDDLVSLYDDEVLPPFVAAGLDPDATTLTPSSIPGRALQQRYIVENPDGFDDRDLLDDAADGSGYSSAHAEHHPVLRALMDNAGLGDLLLIDGTTGDVVYSTKKRIDFGTNAVTGPYSDTGLGDVLEQLAGVAVGESVISDSYFYIPTRGEPVLFAAAAMRSDSTVVGAVVAEVPVSALTAIMTAEQDWTRLGLGQTGESYIVGEDRTLRSDTRSWLEDPEDYLRRADDDTGLIDTVGSPVLLQDVDNPAVTAALGGDDFIGTVDGHLGTKTLAASTNVGIDGLNWAVVVEVDRSETDAAVDSLVERFLLVLVFLLPSIALVGWFLSRILTRPAESLVHAAGRIANGELDAEVADLGRNELGDLGRQLEGVAQQLESREQEIADEEQHINEMLQALLPVRLVDRVRRGEHAIGDIFDTATVVSMTISDVPDSVIADSDLALEIADRMNAELVTLMGRYGAERIQRTSTSQLYLTGLDQDDARVSDAVEFTLAAMQKVADVGAEFGQVLTVRAGMSSGDVATGVLGTNQLSFGVWGDPATAAVTLGSLAEPGELLVDAGVSDELGREWDIEPATSFPGLADGIEASVVNGRIDAATDANR